MHTAVSLIFAVLLMFQENAASIPFPLAVLSDSRHWYFDQDVAAKIAAFANQSSRAVCVLSATGSVSRVVLRHPGDASPMTRVHSSPPYKNPAIYEVRAQRNATVMNLVEFSETSREIVPGSRHVPNGA